jgi:hypothetical protein
MSEQLDAALESGFAEWALKGSVTSSTLLDLEHMRGCAMHADITSCKDREQA